MVKIDWVEIPGGKFIVGFTEAQKELIRQKVRRKLRYDSLPIDELKAIEEHLTKLKKLWDIEPTSPEYFSYLEKIELEIRPLKRKYQELKHLFTVEAQFAKTPTYSTKIKTFYIARYPVTEEQCDEFFARFGHEKELHRTKTGQDGVNIPEQVVRKVADRFSRWIGGRLPKAIEWEYAARGAEGWLYPWGNEWNPAAGNFGRSADEAKIITPIDRYPEGVSPFGVWDMVGNLGEWIVEGGRYKGVLLKEREIPTWFWYLPVFTRYLSLNYPHYVGFRPVKDRWDKELWASIEVKANDG